MRRCHEPIDLPHRVAPSLTVHELSIAVNLLEVATEAADRLGATRVAAIHLRLGPLAGVDGEALRFAFDLAKEGTRFAGAGLLIEPVPVVVHCPHCREPRELASIQRFRCPVCDTPTAEVVQGRDLELAALEVIDDDDENR